MLSAREFLHVMNTSLSPKANNRTLIASFDAGFSPGPGRGSIAINFINLPEPRYRQRRGGGAEAENNRQLFMVWGFGADIDDSVSSVKAEQSINGIGTPGSWAPKMRAKTGDPSKVALYLINYINDVASKFDPNYTHE
jgi:hypothetical protein